MSIETAFRATVTGEIILAKEMDSFFDAVVHIYLEDVSLQDNPSMIVAQQMIRNVSHEKKIESRLPFALHADNINKYLNYSVFVHIDMQGDGKINLGDYISMQSYPVLTLGYPDKIFVSVKHV